MQLPLAGRVLDEAGNAVPWLKVLARTWRVFGATEAGGGVARVERQTVSSVDGRFAFPAVPDGEYELETEDTELYERARALVRAGVDSAVLIVKTKAGSLYVHGIVESTLGGPVAGARVEVVGRPTLAAVSDQAGAYAVRLPPTALQSDTAFRFSRAGYRDAVLPIGSPDAPESEGLVRNARLRPLDQAAALTGSVTGDDGLPVRLASVQLFSTTLQRRYEAFTDEAGRFSLKDVEPSNDYRLWIRAQSQYKDYVQEGIRVGSEEASLDVVLKSLEGATLQGLMVDPGGGPLPAFSLWVRASQGFSKLVTGDPQGAFGIGDLPEGPVTLETRASPLLSVTGIQMKRGGVQEVRVTLDVGDHRLEGQVLTSDALPVAGARVALYWSRVEGRLRSQSFRESVSDASGNFLFTQLASGVHTLNVTAAGFRNRSVQQPVGFDTPPVEIQLQPNP